MPTSKTKYPEKIFAYANEETKKELMNIIANNEDTDMSKLVRTIINHNLYISKVPYSKMRDDLNKRWANLK
jgi:hypothetical protein